MELKFRNEIYRLISFSDVVPFNLCTMLAKNGFYCISFRTAQCYFCHVKVTIGNISVEHLCQFSTQNIRLPRNRVNYLYEANRIISFLVIGWPRKPNNNKNHVSCLDLAKSGFFFSLESNCPRCAFCTVEIRDWRRNDIVDMKHRQRNPNCLILNGLVVINVQLGSEATQNTAAGNTFSVPQGSYGGVPEILTRLGILTSLNHRYLQFCNAGSRLASFIRWPVSIHQMLPFATLSLAGFFYTGHDNHVMCYQCEVVFNNCVPSDDIWMEHAFKSPYCLHVNLHKGVDYVQQVLYLKNSVQGASSVYRDPLPARMSEVPREMDRSQRTPRENRRPRRKYQRPTENAAGDAQPKPPMKIKKTSNLQSGIQNEPTPSTSYASSNGMVQDRDKCMLCNTSVKVTAILPCRHITACGDCGDKYETCPICHARLMHVIHEGNA